MLGMIEINLLPPEYRVQERTPLGLFLTIVAGICVVGGLCLWGIQVNKELNSGREEKERLLKEKEKWEARKKEAEDLKAQIDTAKKRQGTIIEISQSKMMWSQKLCQLGRILTEYPQFWIDQISVDRTRGINTNFFAVSDDLNKIAEFREAVQSDSTFWYHFKDFEATNYSLTKSGMVPTAGGQPITAPTISFFCTLPPK